MMSDTSVDHEALLGLAQRAAVAGGEILLAMRATALTVETKSSLTDPVSEADRRSQAAIFTVIADRRPNDTFTGEESLFRDGDGELRWIIDPLDGTVNYLYGSDHWAVSIAAADGDGVLAAVVHAPALRRTFIASRGNGAWVLNDGGERQGLSVRDCGSLDRALVGTGFSYLPDGRRVQAATLAHLLPRIADIRRAGSAALDLSAVAHGTLDAFFETDLEEWDWAAAALIASEAGAVVRPLTGAGGRSGIIASAPGLFEALSAAVL